MENVRSSAAPKGLVLDEELIRVCAIAAAAGEAGRHSAPVTYGTLMVGLLLADDPASRWVQSQLNDTQRQAVLSDAGIEGVVLQTLRSAPPRSSSSILTSLSASAADLLWAARRHAEADSVALGTRHLINAFLGDTPNHHREKLERWGLSDPAVHRDFAQRLRSWRRGRSDDLTDQRRESDSSSPPKTLGELLEGIPAQLTRGGAVVVAAASAITRRSQRLQLSSRDILVALIWSSVESEGSVATRVFSATVEAVADPDLQHELGVEFQQSAGSLGDIDRRITLSAGAESVLRTAAEAERLVFGHSAHIGRHGLIVALLTLPQTGAAQSLVAGGVRLADLRSLFLEEAAKMLPAELVERFRNAIQMYGEKSADPAAVIGYEPTYSNDSPLGHENVLGTEDEAKAFARLIASQRVKPPLSIGVFGDWGSGKSFFMNRIATHVAALSKHPSGNVDGEEPRGRIIQIRFNAWHYIESNLWASLVEYIFTELEEGLCIPETGGTAGRTLLERLSTAQQLKLDAAEALAVARSHSTQAATDLASARKALEAATVRERTAGELVRAAWDTVWNGRTQEQKQEINEAAKALGLSNLDQSVEGLRAAVSLARSEAGRSAVYGRAMITRFGSRRGVALLIAAVVLPLLLTWSIGALAGHPGILNELQGLVVAGATTIAALTAFVGRGTQFATRALSVLEGIGERVDRAEAAERAEQLKKVEDAAQNAANLRAAVDSAELKLKEAAKREEEAAREFSEGSARGRLSRFIRERVAKGDYAKHLGVVASVRKDFGELSELMLAAELDLALKEERERLKAQYQRRLEHIKATYSEQLKNEMEALQEMAGKAAEQTQRLERIVLYIDDLDRCPAEKVIEVLQAVHLLLCFPLFVVVVAVDARWLARSLEEQYPHLLSEPDPAMVAVTHRDSGRDANEIGAPGMGEKEPALARPDRGDGQAIRARPSGASPHDYLEKIFQLAYWVRPMDGPVSSRYVRYRLAADLESAPNTPNDPANEKVSRVPSATQRALAIAGGTPPPVDDEAFRDRGAGTPTGAAKEEPLPELPPAPLMKLSKDEAELMEKLAPFLGGSPRRGLRFVNTYRVVKSGLRLPDGEPQPAKLVYVPLLTQLALVCGAPRSARRYFSTLSTQDADLAVGEFMTRTSEDLSWAAEGERSDVAGVLKVVQDELGSGGSIRPLKDAAAIAQRYGFVNCR